MIYGVTLAQHIVKAFGSNAFTVTHNKLCEMLSLDPTVSNMDTVILGPRDAEGPYYTSLIQAIKNKHPSVCVIYVYTNDKEKNLFTDCLAVKVKRINDKELRNIVNEHLGEHLEAHGLNRSREDLSIKSTLPIEKEANIIDSLNTVPDPVPVTEEPTPEPVAPEDPEPLFIPEGSESVTPVSLEKPTTTSPVSLEKPDIPETPLEATVEKRSPSDILSIKGWDNLIKALERDTITANLMKENQEYAGVIEMLEVLDIKIANIFTDTHLSTTDKFNQIKELGVNRTMLTSQKNNILVHRLIDIINSITLTAKNLVEDETAKAEKVIHQITTDKLAITDESLLDKAIQERTDIQLELLNTVKQILDLYNAMNLTVSETITQMNDKLPSGSPYINNMLNPVGTLFTPTNSADLATTLMRDLQDNRITMSALEQKVRSIIDLFFKLTKQDEEIIKHQRMLIDLLKANKVEDIIVVNTLLKSIMHVFVGCRETGFTSTVLTWSGVRSHQKNVLLVDLSGHHKLQTYGIKPISIDELSTERPHNSLTIVEAELPTNPEDLQSIIEELRSHLDYYPVINVMVDSSQAEFLEQLTEESLSISYYTDCTRRSLLQMQSVVAAPVNDTLARKLILRDCPVNPLDIARQLNIDPTITKLISIPYIETFRVCNYRGTPPYEFTDVRKYYEEAFR